MRDPEGAGDLARILYRLGAAAVAEALRRLLSRLLPRRDAHGDLDDVASLLDQQGRGERRVDATAHADDDTFSHLARGVAVLVCRAISEVGRLWRAARRSDKWAGLVADVDV